MNRDDFKISIAAANGRLQRLVSIEQVGGREFRDNINPNSSISRTRLIHSVADGCGVDPSELDWLDEAIINEADRADEEVDQALSDIGDEDKRSTADVLVELTLANYRIGRTHKDEAFAVKNDGPNVALMFRGSRDALRASMSRAFRAAHGRTPNSSALTDALMTLQGDAYEATPEEVHLRLAEHETSIVIDLGDSTGKAVVVGPAGWQMLDRSPILFRRTAATGSLPVPERGGDLSELRRMMNVSSESWPLVLGWMVAALVPNMPHPILLLGGPQGTGKSTAARQLGSIIDPSPAQLRSQPRDEETWAISASASWLVSVDNISVIGDWWSDGLCKAVTGDGWIRRKLYSDGDLAILTFRRVILLTSIDAGALRGDLGERILLVDLEPIHETKRRPERDIERQFEAARPRIFGALLDLLSKVLAVLPDFQLPQYPRMADFARVLAAMDQITADDADNADKQSLEIYLGQRQRIAETVIESDSVALAIQALVERVGAWEGTASELVDEITPERPPKGWPRTPQALGGRLTRLKPALEQAGIVVAKDREGHSRTRKYHITRSEKPCDGLSASSALSAPAEIPEENALDHADNLADNCGRPGDACPHACPHENLENVEENTAADDAANADNVLQPLSNWSDV